MPSVAGVVLATPESHGSGEDGRAEGLVAGPWTMTV